MNGCMIPMMVDVSIYVYSRRHPGCPLLYVPDAYIFRISRRNQKQILSVMFIKYWIMWSAFLSTVNLWNESESPSTAFQVTNSIASFVFSCNSQSYLSTAFRRTSHRSASVRSKSWARHESLSISGILFLKAVSSVDSLVQKLLKCYGF